MALDNTYGIRHSSTHEMQKRNHLSRSWILVGLLISLKGFLFGHQELSTNQKNFTYQLPVSHVLLKSVWLPGQSNGEAMGKSDRSQKHVPWLRWLNEVPEVTQVELVNHGVPVWMFGVALSCMLMGNSEPFQMEKSPSWRARHCHHSASSKQAQAPSTATRRQHLIIFYQLKFIYVSPTPLKINMEP